ncbi:MAG TPA: hypothetical protein VFI74_04465 [Candidatus Saccharimonadales bacterium]|nr:hypothetical protein [Candidatus Saccharimonadales bacterium]
MIRHHEPYNTIHSLTTYYDALLEEQEWGTYKKNFASDMWERSRMHTSTHTAPATLQAESTAFDAQAQYAVTLREQQFHRRTLFSSKVGELLVHEWQLHVEPAAFTIDDQAAPADLRAFTNAPLGDIHIALWVKNKAWYTGEVARMAQKYDVHTQTGRGLLQHMRATTMLFLPHELPARTADHVAE